MTMISTAPSHLDRILLMVGSPGRYHLLVAFLLCCMQFPVSFSDHLLTFYTITPKHRCRADSNLTLGDYDLRPIVTENGKKVLLRLQLVCRSVGPFKRDQTWELVCERESLVALLPYVKAVAAMIGALVSGILADKYGRKYVLIMSLLFHTSFGVFLHFLPLYGIFATVFTIQGFLIAVRYFCIFYFKVGSTVHILSASDRKSPHEMAWKSCLSNSNIPMLRSTDISRAGMANQTLRYIQLVISAPGVVVIGYFCVSTHYNTGSNHEALTPILGLARGRKPPTLRPPPNGAVLQRVEAGSVTKPAPPSPEGLSRGTLHAPWVRSQAQIRDNHLLRPTPRPCIHTILHMVRFEDFSSAFSLNGSDVLSNEHVDLVHLWEGYGITRALTIIKVCSFTRVEMYHRRFASFSEIILFTFVCSRHSGVVIRNSDISCFRQCWSEINSGSSLSICGICCMFSAIINHQVVQMRSQYVSEKGLHHFAPLFGLIGKCIAGASSYTLWMHAIKIFPTGIRGLGLGSCLLWSRVAYLFCAEYRRHGYPFPIYFTDRPLATIAEEVEIGRTKIINDNDLDYQDTTLPPEFKSNKSSNHHDAESGSHTTGSLNATLNRSILKRLADALQRKTQKILQTTSNSITKLGCTKSPIHAVVGGGGGGGDVFEPVTGFVFKWDQAEPTVKLSEFEKELSTFWTPCNEPCEKKFFDKHLNSLNVLYNIDRNEMKDISQNDSVELEGHLEEPTDSTL
ncbi:solute carrier family 22 member 8 [Caerostris extrusa]|uniref:Solute carrier family 22 member 8 n=1 Tax=Caerostris extrusa TaxID=172846 RepID=A0AAV4PK78_CAEEX|nr:solute carrier family 22 member 8 [Caerostris extrusa]